MLEKTSKRAEKYTIFIITGLLLLVILFQLDIRNLGLNLSLLFSPQILLAFIVYLLSYVLRAVRWRYLLGHPSSLPSLCHIVALHTVSNNIFPFRSGELTFPYFCRRFHNIPVAISTSTLISARVADLCSLGPLFFFSLISLNMPISRFSTILLIPIIFVGMAITLPYVFDLFLYLLKNLSRGEKLANNLALAREQYISLWQSKKLAGLLVLSLAIWLVKFGAFYLVAENFLDPTTFHLTYWKVVLGSTVSELIAALPLQTFAELGMFEAGWTGALMFMGMARKEAVTLGFSLHLTILLFSLIVGIPAYLLAPFRKKDKATNLEDR